MVFLDKLADIFLIFYVIWLVMAIINAFTDTLRQKPSLKDKPLDSYSQVVKIVLYFIGFIVLFSILTGQNRGYYCRPGSSFGYFDADFKDSILGFVASLQVSANDMVRIGDWITMPKYGRIGTWCRLHLRR